MARKQSTVRSNTRENLLEAFWTLYQKKKIEQISIKEITQLAGYNRSTFYDYFIDIYDALEKLEESLLAFLVESIESYRQDGFDIDIFHQLAEVYNTKGDYFSLLLGEKSDPHFTYKMKSVVKPLFFELWGLTEEEERAHYVFEFFFSAITGSLTYWYLSGRSMSYDDFFPMVRSMVVKGGLTELQKISIYPERIREMERW
jgi:AcrR family transcriptional regulator